MFQLEQSADPNFCFFHEEHHPENSCLDWKRVVNSICSHTLDTESNMQEQKEDIDDDEEVAPDETSSSRHVVNAYHCSQVMLKTTTEKQPPKEK